MVRKREEPERADKTFIRREETTGEGSESSEFLNNHRKPKQDQQIALNLSTQEKHITDGDVFQGAEERNRPTDQTHRQQIQRNWSHRAKQRHAQKTGHLSLKPLGDKSEGADLNKITWQCGHRQQQTRHARVQRPKRHQVSTPQEKNYLLEQVRRGAKGLHERKSAEEATNREDEVQSGGGPERLQLRWEIRLIYKEF